jgi:hypothetical protein
MPKNIVIDFEIAAFKALKGIFPDSRIYFCNFHLGQSIYRQLQKRGLAKLYGGNSEFRRYIQVLLALAYEKPVNVHTIFKLWEKQFNVKFSNNETSAYIQYFDNTYIGTRQNSIFNVENWSTYERILQNIPTTTNVAEAWNKGINWSIAAPH